ncbi:hypothetical protein ACG0Z6_01785 [Roseateles sp. BYS180W]|uniref:Uncharacterized protein n=1 Tax=Roseateles rivi TaxID=3299028 RepID=A0ABW7FRS1_9BURK
MTANQTQRAIKRLVLGFVTAAACSAGATELSAQGQDAGYGAKRTLNLSANGVTAQDELQGLRETTHITWLEQKILVQRISATGHNSTLIDIAAAQALAQQRPELSSVPGGAPASAFQWVRPATARAVALQSAACVAAQNTLVAIADRLVNYCSSASPVDTSRCLSVLADYRKAQASHNQAACSPD